MRSFQKQLVQFFLCSTYFTHLLSNLGTLWFRVVENMLDNIVSPDLHGCFLGGDRRILVRSLIERGRPFLTWFISLGYMSPHNVLHSYFI